MPAVLYTCYIRPVVACMLVSCGTPQSPMTKINSTERVQKCASRVILGCEYSYYSYALIQLNLQTLESRQSDVFLKFGEKKLISDTFHHVLQPETFQPARQVEKQHHVWPCHTAIQYSTLQTLNFPFNI